MEKIMKIIFNRSRIDVFYPPDDIEKWKLMKRRHLTLGYEWIDFSTTQSMYRILMADSKNMKRYEKMKKKNEKVRRKFPGHSNIPTIFPPPEPNTEERFEILKRWSINDNYNICMLTDYLTKNHDIRPCRDYEPDNLKYTYSLYSEMSENRTIVRSNTYHNCPSAPPVTNQRPPTPGVHSTPPKYDDLNL